MEIPNFLLAIVALIIAVMGAELLAKMGKKMREEAANVEKGKTQQ